MLFGFTAHSIRLIAFGFFMCFCSSIGQTFFISLFNGELRTAFGVSHGELGGMYSIGTIISAAVLMAAGRLADHLNLRIVAVGVLLGLAAAAAAMSIVWTVSLLPIVFFGLRFFGQGLAGHTAMTAMGRYFDALRGRAIAGASIGFAAGEALLPSGVVALLAVMEWRSAWMLFAGLAVLSIPVALLLLAGTPSGRPQAPASSSGSDRHYRLGDVLRDFRLWLRMPLLMAPAFVVTGLFFHQVQLASEKGWPLALIAGSFPVFAITSLVTAVTFGPIVDAWSARRMLPVVILPLAAASLCVLVFDAAWTPPIFMFLTGITIGANNIVGSAIWPELYGTSHLGAIKAFAQSSGVLASGLSPVIFGLCIDGGITIAVLAGFCAAYCAASCVLALIANRRR